MNDENSFNRSLNGFRGFCCAMVMLGHVGVIAEHQALISPDIFKYAQPFISPLGHGVELLFMISGFLIPASLKRHGDVARFLVDRALRIMPVFVIIHFLVFTVGPIAHYKWMSEISHMQYVEYFLANLFLVQNILGLPLAQQNAWSLTYEAVFYISAAGIYFSISRKKPAFLILFILITIL
jgi:peptidoglycan/LPS O-acetylase OafA/YrhL